jgi:predicted DNA-binding protein with PD1-like motif
MANLIELKPVRTLTGRLDHDSDLLQELTAICVHEKITQGQIRAIGAVKRARIAFYDQTERIYKSETFDRPLEIVQLSGNVSLKDGLPFVHAHIALSDEKGTMLGGHLAEGTVVFACEVFIEAFEGPPLERTFDEATGLGLWDLSE